MSLNDYKVGQAICCDYTDDDFYGIVQALMRFADTDNLVKLQNAWPQVWKELQARYSAPGGRLLGEEGRKCDSCNSLATHFASPFGNPSEPALCNACFKVLGNKS